MLKSDDPQLAANKRLVYDMWRTLVDARDVEAAKKYLDKDYIQHNPIADTGRDEDENQNSHHERIEIHLTKQFRFFETVIFNGTDHQKRKGI